MIRVGQPVIESIFLCLLQFESLVVDEMYQWSI